MVDFMLPARMVKMRMLNLIEISELPSGVVAESCLATRDLARVTHSQVLSAS